MLFVCARLCACVCVRACMFTCVLLFLSVTISKCIYLNFVFTVHHNLWNKVSLKNKMFLLKQELTNLRFKHYLHINIPVLGDWGKKVAPSLYQVSLPWTLRSVDISLDLTGSVHQQWNSSGPTLPPASYWPIDWFDLQEDLTGWRD